MKKKTYIQPAVEAAQVQTTVTILTVSTIGGNVNNGGGGGGSIDPD